MAWYVAKITILKAIHNEEVFGIGHKTVAKITILKAIHNKTAKASLPLKLLKLQF